MWPALAPAYLQADLIQKWPYPKRIRLVSTPKELEDIGSLQTAILELFPKDKYKARNKGKSYPSEFKSDTGFILDVMSYEQDKAEMAGPTIGLLAWNEPMPEALWLEGLARLRKGGLCLVAMTSLKDEPWVVDKILGKADGGNIRVLYSDVEENCKEHGINGTLDHDQIEKILAQYDPDEREARKTGKPLSLSGRIYKDFDRAVHVAKEEIVPPDGGVSHYLVVDPAIGKPLSIILAYADATGAVNIYKEWPDFDFEGSKDSNLSVRDYAEIIKGLEAGKTVEARILDRHFGSVRRTLGGLTLKQEFAEQGLDFIDSYMVGEGVPEVETGILKVKDYLRYDKSKPLDGLNRPKVLISPSCRNTIAAFERWGRNPDTGKPKEQYKDFADVVRYLLMANPVVETHANWNVGRPAYYGVGRDA